MMRPSWALGIDGGGTKTEFRLEARPGAAAASARSGSSSLTRAPEAAVRRELEAGLAAVLAAVGIEAGQVAACCGGFAGACRAAAASVLDEMLRKLLPRARVRVTTDQEIAWMGATGGADGIIVIAGTGSAGYGRRGGTSARAGGQAAPGGDPGSGEWIRGRAGRETPAVAAAAAAGEAAAQAVLSRAGEELAALAADVARRLGDAALPVYWAGSVFQAVPVRDAFCAALGRRGLAPAAAAAETPAQGALRMAWLLS